MHVEKIQSLRPVRNSSIVPQRMKTTRAIECACVLSLSSLENNSEHVWKAPGLNAYLFSSPVLLYFKMKNSPRSTEQKFGMNSNALCDNISIHTITTHGQVFNCTTERADSMIWMCVSILSMRCTVKSLFLSASDNRHLKSRWSFSDMHTYILK